MSESTVTTFAVAIFVGFAMVQFFGSITRDLIAPVVAGIFPGVQQSVGKIVVNVGGIQLNIGDALGATLNLAIAMFVVSITLPYIRAYSPLGGRR